MDYAVILAGGIGSRFWPLSRQSLPKQFLRITGTDTLLKSTIRRIRTIIQDKNIFIITNRLHLAQVKMQIKYFNIPQKNIILEPKPLDTLPAISLCAHLINLKDNQANLLILPSDHYIKDQRRFKQSMFKALDLGRKDLLCLVGIKSDRPTLGYGYIQTGRKIKQDIFYVNSFQEKPPLNEVKRLFTKKRIFWNSGIFCFKAQVLLKEMKIYVPEIYHKIIRIENKQKIENIWSSLKAVSIDYGLIEKSKNLVMVVARFFWQDLGSWDALCDLLPKDRKNNIILSDCINLDSTDILLYSQDKKRFIATIGLEDLIIVDTPDALLVCKKGKSQDIKKLVKIIKKKRKKCV